MTNEELNAAVYEKMDTEQIEFIGWLLKLPPEEMLEHSFEYTVRQDFLMSMEENILADEQAQALLRSETPLADVYKEFQKLETGYLDVVRDSIAARAKIEMEKDQARREALRSLPVYLQSAEYARDHGEQEPYRKSRQANIACRAAIEDAITAHYRENLLDDAAVKQVVDTFGYDRTLYVLAATVQHKEWDGRISNDNKVWARTVPVIEDRIDGGHDRNVSILLDRSHPGLMDLFLTQARRSQAQEQSKAQTAGRPSMLARLKEKVQNTSPKHSAKSKEPER